MASPVSASVCAVCACFWLYLWNRRATYESVGLSYRKVVHDRERWRILTATFAHLEIGHLLMNLFSLWSCAGIEPEIGSFEYFRITCILIVRWPALVIDVCCGGLPSATVLLQAVANALELAAYHACIFVFGLGQYVFVSSLEAVGRGGWVLRVYSLAQVRVHVLRWLLRHWIRVDDDNITAKKRSGETASPRLLPAVHIPRLAITVCYRRSPSWGCPSQ